MRSDLNRDVALAQPQEFAPLKLGPLTVDPPVVLAPMAGVTNAAFRTLCREFSADRCLYVSEMITARSFAMGHAKTLRLASFGPRETTKSIQLYGTHPNSLAHATQILANEWGVDHIDMNFGCPVRKVTANGGGSAIPVRPRLMARLVKAVVDNAGAIPVTVKFRKGIDDDLLTFLDAGRVAEQEGCQMVALHARTAAQLYNGDADWPAITELKNHVTSIPVLGNGDVFEAFDALRMMRQTGCDGVVVGRGCLGRPWLFGELVEVFEGREPAMPPSLGAICDTILRHADLLIELFRAPADAPRQTESPRTAEAIAMQQMRKFSGWYLKSFPGVKVHLPGLHLVSTRDDLAQRLDALTSQLTPELPYPESALRARRAKGGRTQTVALPHGYAEDRLSDEPPRDDPADFGSASISGG